METLEKALVAAAFGNAIYRRVSIRVVFNPGKNDPNLNDWLKSVRNGFGVLIGFQGNRSKHERPPGFQGMGLDRTF